MYGNYDSYDFDSGWDLDWGGSSSSSYDYGFDSSDNSGISTDNIYVYLVVFIIFLILLYCSKNFVTTNTKVSNKLDYIYNLANVVSEIEKTDYFFNEAKFSNWADEVFIKVQKAWSDRNLEEIRIYESESLFEEHTNQINSFISNKQINVLKDITVNYSKIYSFKQEGAFETIGVVVNSSMIDYIKNEVDGKIVNGSETEIRTHSYLMEFIRKKGVMSNEMEFEPVVVNCPNCGANVEIIGSGKCKYCGSLLTTGTECWILNNIEPFMK